MELGRKIYELRTKNGFSQDKLAELLDVSRQSISKWENNLAVPDLDKIIKLSNIFNVSLDELIKGELIKESDEVTIKTEYHQSYGFSKQYMTGMVLIVISLFIILISLLMNILALGLLISIPLFICSIICFVIKRNPGLWCAWTLYLLVMVYIRLATGINTSLVLHTFRYHHSMNYMRLLIAYGLLALEIALVVYTIKTLLKNHHNDKNKFIIYLTIFVIINGFKRIFPMTMFYKRILGSIVSYSLAYSLCFAILDYINLFVITKLIIYIVYYFKTRKHIASK